MMSDTDIAPRVSHLLTFALVLLFAICLVNLNGGDWDGVQIMLGSMFPAEAAKGYIVHYREAWQPLTYAILRLVYKATQNVQICMFLPAVFGTVGITFLLAAMRKVTCGRVHLLFLVGILLLIPELLFGAIYMNSTVFGYAFACAALWCVVDDWMGSRVPRPGWTRQFLGGGLLALAALCRFDFLLAYPMFLFLLLRARSTCLWKKSFAFTVGSVAVCGLACLSGVLDFRGLIETFTSHVGSTTDGGWFAYPPVAKVLLTIIGANILAWMTAGAGLLHVMRQSVCKRRWFDLGGLVALAALAYPVKSISSPKYLIPLLMFMALFLAWTLERMMSTGRLRSPLLSGVMFGGVMLACFLPIHPSRNRDAMVRWTSQTWRGTDDGPRSFWGYMFALRELSHKTANLEWLESLMAGPGDLVLVAPFDGWIANGSISQPILFYLAYHCRDVEIGPDYLWGQRDDKRILLTEPNALNANVAQRFAQTGPPPRRSTIPLMDFTFDEIVLLRLFACGCGSEAELIARTNGSPETVHETLRSLVRRNMIEPVGPGDYRLKHNFFQAPQFHPDLTGGHASGG